MNLFYLTDARYGGWVSCAEAVAHSTGWPVVKIANRTELSPRSFYGTVQYRNMSLVDAVLNTSIGSGLILCTAWKQYGPETEALLSKGAAIILHDPTEFHKDLLAAIKRYNTHVIVLRPSNQRTLATLGIEATYVPMPYRPSEAQRLPRSFNAAAWSRLDWDKHTDIIVQANALLDQQQYCEIWGAENRLYTHHKLDTIDPNWRRYYRGQFPREHGSSVTIGSRCFFAVDMSAIAGDGGDVQYSALEALDAGCLLVLNAAWLPDDLLAACSVTAATPADLAAVLSSPPTPLRPEASQLLARHTDAYQRFAQLAGLERRS